MFWFLFSSYESFSLKFSQSLSCPSIIFIVLTFLHPSTFHCSSASRCWGSSLSRRAQTSLSISTTASSSTGIMMYS